MKIQSLVYFSHHKRYNQRIDATTDVPSKPDRMKEDTQDAYYAILNSGSINKTPDVHRCNRLNRVAT